ncbi:MAG: hypothetical protein PHR51_00460 [Patescibacteria group bacterium]|nr:hypothetical protein [Patescibacteria group bacterium]
MSEEFNFEGNQEQENPPQSDWEVFWNRFDAEERNEGHSGWSGFYKESKSTGVMALPSLELYRGEFDEFGYTPEEAQRITQERLVESLSPYVIRPGKKGYVPETRLDPPFVDRGALYEFERATRSPQGCEQDKDLALLPWKRRFEAIDSLLGGEGRAVKIYTTQREPQHKENFIGHEAEVILFQVERQSGIGENNEPRYEREWKIADPMILSQAEKDVDVKKIKSQGLWWE